MKVHVRLISGGSIELDGVDPKGTIADLKADIERHQGADKAPIHRQRLISRGREIKDDEVLSACGIADGADLHLVVRPAGVGQRARSPTFAQHNEDNFIAVNLSAAQVYGPVRTPEQVDQIRNVFDEATRMCMISIIDGIGLWMVILLIAPMWVPTCLLAVTGYYGATNYSVMLLSGYGAFSSAICMASAYIFLAQIGGPFSYIGAFGVLWNLYVMLQTYKLIRGIGKLSNADLDLLRSVETTATSVVTRPPAPRQWIPTLRRSTVPAGTAAAAPAA